MLITAIKNNVPIRPPRSGSGRVKLVRISLSSNPAIADTTKTKKLEGKSRVKIICSPFDARGETTSARMAKSKERKVVEMAAS